MSKQSFFAEGRICQSVSTLAGARDSLAAINTSTVSDRAIVAVNQNNSLYMLRKDSVAVASSPNIIAPGEGGPGRWFLFHTGPTANVAVAVSHAAIPPQSSVDSNFTIAGLASSGADIVNYNLLDSGFPTGVTTGPVRTINTDLATMRFGNMTAATVAAATVNFEMNIQKGG